MKNRPATATIAVIGLIFVLFWLFFGYDMIKERELDNYRNNVTFLAKQKDIWGNLSNEQGFFKYDWKNKTVTKVAQESQEKTLITSKDNYFCMWPGLHELDVNGQLNLLLAYDEAIDLIKAYESETKITQKRTGLTFQERKNRWQGKEFSKIHGYENGFIFDYCGVLYYFEKIRGEYAVSAPFEEIPLCDTYLFMDDKILAITLDHVVQKNDIAYEQCIVYLYDIHEKSVEKIVTTQCDIDSFCINQQGNKFAYLDFAGSTNPVLYVYDIDVGENTSASKPIKKISKKGENDRLMSLNFLILLDTDEVLAVREDEDIFSLFGSSNKTPVLLTKDGQKKAPRKLQKYYIDDIVQ